MKLKALLAQPQSPSFRIVAEIIKAVGPHRVLRQHRSVRFSSGTCQVWEFAAPVPSATIAAQVVAVFIRDRQVCAWRRESLSFNDTVRHYQDKAEAQLCAKVAAIAAHDTAHPGSFQPTAEEARG